MGLLSWLKSWTSDNRDDRDDSAARKLLPAMPMAGAGAQIAQDPDNSETEDALERATKPGSDNRRRSHDLEQRSEKRGG